MQDEEKYTQSSFQRLLNKQRLSEEQISNM